MTENKVNILFGSKVNICYNVKLWHNYEGLREHNWLLSSILGTQWKIYKIDELRSRKINAHINNRRNCLRCWLSLVEAMSPEWMAWGSAMVHQVRLLLGMPASYIRVLV